VDDVEIPGYAELRENFEDTDKRAERIVLEFELKAGLAAYLSTRPDSSMRTLADVIRFNEEHAAEEMPYFRQELFVDSEARGPLTDPLYLRALEYNLQFARNFAALFENLRFDALVSPTNAPAWAIDLLDGDHHLGGSSMPAAVGGFPLVTVPAGFVFDLLPIGLTFMGPPMSEPTLIKLAYAFEQTHLVRRSPRYVPTTLGLP
jgi:amidase